jgi:MFS superfamily sulfate permease-like transporter
VREAVRGAPTPTQSVVFDAEAMNHVDVAGLDALQELSDDLGRDGIRLLVAHVKTPLQQRFDESGLTDQIGRERFHPTVAAAVLAAG